MMDKKEHFWEQFYASHYHSVYSFFLKRLRSAQDANDASQETFFRVMRNDKTPDMTSSAGYLWCTARNLFREILRYNTIREDQIIRQQQDLDQHPSSAPNPEQALVEQQNRDRLFQLVESLPPRCRQVFIMHRFQGLSYQEIAERLGISKKTVTNHMVNALTFLRKNRR